VKTEYTRLGGGLDLVNNPNSVNPGRSILSINYDTPITGGYRSVKGYELLGGGPPSGTDPVLGVAVWQGKVYCIRESAGTGHLYRLDSGSWTDVGSGLALARHDFVSGNFYALASSENLFMVGGGKPWKFDGTTLSEITAAPSGATFIDIHANHLFLGIPAGSLQWSELGNPDGWTAAGGAGELGVSDRITGLAQVAGGVLVIGGEESIKLLYGSSVDNFEVRDFSSNAGIASHTIATIGTTPVFKSSTGLTSLSTVQAFADFQFGSWAQEIAPLFRLQDAEPVAAIALKNANEYRLYWESGLGVVATFNGETPVGISTTIFPDAITLAATGNDLEPGRDLTVFADDAGNVFRLDSGTSFAGEEIKTYLALGYNHFGGPSVRKRFRHLYLDVLADSAVDLYVLPSFNLGSSLIPRHLVAEAVTPEAIITALSAGGLWEFDRWGEFAWGTPILDMTHLWLAGTATHLGLVINTASTTAEQHTIHGYTTHFDVRRLRRGQ
jgi:hypothetical protein